MFVPGIDRMSTASLPQTHRWLMGLYFFLASLAVLFLSAILAMLLVRSSDLRPEPPLPVNVPASLWLSVVFLVVISLGLDRAVAAVRRERQTQFRLAIVGVWLAVLGFLWLQFAGLTVLLERHNQSPARDPRSYGLVYAHAACGPRGGWLTASGDRDVAGFPRSLRPRVEHRPAGVCDLLAFSRSSVAGSAGHVCLPALIAA